MTTKLRVLLDEALTDILAAVIGQYSRVLNVQYVREIPGLPGTKDRPLSDLAKAAKRILVTVDSGFNERTYPPCTHPGIIRIATRNKHEAIQGGIFGRFLRSGYRKHTKGAVTYIGEREARIIDHNGEKTYSF